MSFLDRFKRGCGILCPRCEKSVDGHDEEKCAKAMTRRHFVGMWGAAVAIAYGGGKVILATPSHVKAIEKEIGNGGWMVSSRGGCVVSSCLGFIDTAKDWKFKEVGHARSIDSFGNIAYHTKETEYLQLRAQGFRVQFAETESQHKAQGREAAWPPDLRMEDQFPSVDKW